MADLFGGLVSGGISYGMQKSLQKDAQDYNTLMWNKANAYNSPLQQMMRFKSAGLNPNLIYGQMNQSASAPTMSASGAPHSDMSMLDTAQLGLIDAQEELIRSEAAKNKQDIVESGSRVDVNKATVDKYAHENNLTDAQADEVKANIDKINAETKNIKLAQNKIKAEIKFIKSQRNLTDWQAVQASVDAMWADKKNAAVVDNICSQTGLNRAEAKEILTLMYAKLANINSSTALNRAQAHTQVILRKLYNSQSEGQDISNSQAQERFDKDMQALDQAISTGSIQSDLAEDLPNTMKFVSVLGTILGSTAPLLGAGIIRGGMKIPKPASGNTATYIDNWSYGGLTSGY